MRVETIVLEKYGAYEGRTLSFRSDAMLHVVVGANEAGKSTALAAISDLLFAFDRRTKEDVFKPGFRFDLRDLRLGASLRLSDGRQIVFRRRRGNRNTIVDGDDKPLGDDLLDPVLGVLDREAFELEFGLNAERLRAGGDALLRAGGRLAESLAEGSAGLGALNRLRQQLQAEGDEIFTARKVAGKPFYVALGRYEDARSALREAIVTADSVAQAEAARADILARQKALEDEHGEAARMLARLHRARNTNAKLAELKAIETELAELPAPPEAVEERLPLWREAVAAEKSVAERIAEVNETIAENAAAIADLRGQPQLLASAQEIATLQKASGAAEQSRSDLPRRERERYGAWSNLERAAHALGLTSAGVLIGAMPTRLALAGIRETIAQESSHAQKMADALERLDKAVRRRDELEQQVGGQGYAADPASLKRAFAGFQNIPGDAAALNRQAAGIQQDLRDIETRIQRLSPPPPPLGDLVRLPLPDASRVEEARRRQESLRDDLERTEGELEETTGATDGAERELKKLEQSRKVATRDNLAAARKNRDEALQAVRGSKQEAREAQLAVLDDANASLDRITDELLENADDAARKLSLEQELVRLRAKNEQLRNARKRLGEEQEAARVSWRAMWSALDIEPEEPAAMAAWLGTVLHAIADYDNLSADKKEMEALRIGLEAQREPLGAFLRKLGMEPPGDATINQMYSNARDALEDVETRWTERRLLAQTLDNIKKEIAEIETGIAGLAATENILAEGWRKAMETLHCTPDVNLAQANEALRVWEESILAHDKFRDEESRLNGIRTRIGDFEKAVAAACARIAPDLTGADAFAAVEELTGRLQDARDGARELERLGAETGRLQQRVTQMEKDRAVAGAHVAEGVGALGLSDSAALGPALDRLVRRGELLAAGASARRDLAAMTNGMSAEDLRAEQAGVDFDMLDGEIARLEDRLEKIREEEKDAYAASRDAEQELANLMKGRNAIAFAQQKQESAGDLLDTARRWLVRTAAAQLAGQAIERHRQSAQDPVMARTSSLFSHATAGAFQGLVAAYGDNDELVFRTIRADGEQVAVAGLSDGTRDQLFLALRLALLERRGGEAMPFFGDDLLTSFDEERTGLALEMLADFGRERQVILFSHHRHVANIALERLGGGVEIVEL